MPLLTPRQPCPLPPCCFIAHLNSHPSRTVIPPLTPSHPLTHSHPLSPTPLWNPQEAVARTIKSIRLLMKASYRGQTIVKQVRL